MSHLPSLVGFLLLKTIRFGPFFVDDEVCSERACSGKGNRTSPHYSYQPQLPLPSDSLAGRGQIAVADLEPNSWRFCLALAATLRRPGSVGRTTSVHCGVHT